MQTSIPKIIHKRFKQWASPSKGQGLLFGGARKLEASSKGIPYQHENSVNCVGGFRCCHEASGGSDATSLCRTRCTGAVVLLWIQFRFIARAAAEPIEFHISTGAGDPHPLVWKAPSGGIETSDQRCEIILQSLPTVLLQNIFAHHKVKYYTALLRTLQSITPYCKDLQSSAAYYNGTIACLPSNNKNITKT